MIQIKPGFIVTKTTEFTDASLQKKIEGILKREGLNKVFIDLEDGFYTEKLGKCIGRIDYKSFFGEDVIAWVYDKQLKELFHVSKSMMRYFGETENLKDYSGYSGGFYIKVSELLNTSESKVAENYTI